MNSILSLNLILNHKSNLWRKLNNLQEIDYVLILALKFTQAFYALKTHAL